MNVLFLQEIIDVLNRGDIHAIRDFVDEQHPAVVAEFVEDLEPSDLQRFLQCLKPLERGEVFSYLPVQTQLHLARTLKRDRLAELVTHMDAGERADLVKRLGQEVLEALEPALAQAEREDIRRLMSYEEGTAGSTMTSDYATLRPELTAQQAIERLRKEAPDKETVYYSYVIDADRKLLGAVTLKDLILAHPQQRVDSLMLTEPVAALVDEPQEEVARKIERFDLLALPVVDTEHRLLGIVTHDEAFDILREEQTEDLERLMGITGEAREEGYLLTPASVHFRRRALWAVGLASMELLSGWILHHYQASLSRLVLLAVYMPMLAATGGNTGAQSASTVIRSLALQEITPLDAVRVVWKEFRISLLMGITLGVLAWGKVFFLTRASEVPPGFLLWQIGATVALAMTLQVITSTVFGALLPLAAARFRLDPAVVASPALTTAVDITGLLIYFGLAGFLLRV